ncbi:hypothetical protein ACHWQZ_G017925 [Mnemiopsis leidyi]
MVKHSAYGRDAVHSAIMSCMGERVFGAIVKLLLTVDESEDQDTMQAILTTMEHSGFRDAAEWLTTGIHTKPCLNCGRFNRRIGTKGAGKNCLRKRRRLSPLP